MSPANKRRAAKLAKILRDNYGAGTEGYATTLRDLLADAQHMCDAKRISYADAAWMASQHHTAETQT